MMSCLKLRSLNFGVTGVPVTAVADSNRSKKAGELKIEHASLVLFFGLEVFSQQDVDVNRLHNVNWSGCAVLLAPSSSVVEELVGASLFFFSSEIFRFRVQRLVLASCDNYDLVALVDASGGQRIERWGHRKDV